MDDSQVASPQKRPPVYQILRDAVEAFGSPTTNVKLRDWIKARYPGIHPGTLNAQRIICTVKQPSRVHYPQCQKPRHCKDHRYDFLYCTDRGQIEWYRPEKHGNWSIERDNKGFFAIRCDGEKLIYPEARGPVRIHPTPKPPATSPTIPLTQQQIDAAKVLHHRLTKWAATDRAFGRMGCHFGWDRESCILKAAVINDLYSTRVYAIWRMAEHLMNVMVNPSDDPADVVEAIASLPDDDGTARRKHWSFASKIGHFFINGDKYPIYDSFCRDMIIYHLGRNLFPMNVDNPYRAFIVNLNNLRKISGISATQRDIDRYMWLTGQYREWLKKRDKARINSELRSIFEDKDPQVQQLLGILWPET